MARVFRDRSALSKSVFRRGQHRLGLVNRHKHRNDALPFVEHHAPHTAGRPAHRTHVFLFEAHRLARIGEQHHVVFSVGDCGPDQIILRVKLDGDDAGRALVGERTERRLLDGSHCRGEKHIMRVVVVLDRQYRIDLFVFRQRKQVDDGFAATGSRALRHLVDLEPVDLAQRRKAQHRVVGVGNEEFLDEIVFPGRGCLLAASAAPLRAVVGQRLRLDIARMRKSDHHILGRDQILHRQVVGLQHDFTAPGVAVLRLDLAQFLKNDVGNPLRIGKDIEVIDYLFQEFPVLGDDLVLLKSGQALQAHFEDGLCLRVGQTVTLRRQAVIPRHAVRSRGIAPGPAQHLGDDGGRPRTRHQLHLGLGGRLRALDQLDDGIDIGQRDRQPLLDMRSLAGLPQVEHGPAGDDFAPVRKEGIQHFLDIEQARLTVDQRHHVDTERVLQLGELEQVVQHHFGHLVALQFDHDAHAGLVRLILHVRDSLDALVVDQFGDTLEQRLLVDLIGQLVNDDGLPVALFDILNMGPTPHHQASATGAVAISYALHAIDNACGRKVRRRNDLNDFVDGQVGIAKQRMAGVYDLIEVVRRNVGRHAHCNAR